MRSNCSSQRCRSGTACGAESGAKDERYENTFCAEGEKERKRERDCMCVCACVLGNECTKVTSLHVPMGAASWTACCISVFGCDLAARANALDGVLWLDELSDCICLSTSSSVSILIPSVAVRTMPGGTWSRLGSRIRKIADGLVFCKLMSS